MTIVKYTLLGYAQIFFSTRWYVGLCFLMATFVVPIQGLSGLLSLILANLWASMLGYSKDDIRSGYYGYNGLLTGLALGLTYKFNIAFFIMLLIATFLGVLIANILQSLFRRYLFIPVLSLPFVLTTWIMLASGLRFHGLIYAFEPFEVLSFSGYMPPKAEFFFHSLGATFFQLNTFAGILVATGIFLFSHYSFILALIGLSSGCLIYAMLNGNPSDLYMGFNGFNFVLTDIAVGGIWAVPGIDMLIMAAIASAICALITSATVSFLNPYGLPPLAFPFVVTTCFIFYALKQRNSPTRFQIITIPEATPEMNLKRHRNTTTRLLQGERPAFCLPLSGEWIVTQGIDGRHTHKELWMHAWDFEIKDEMGKAFRGDASTLEDFYAYNMPIYAPADGRVVKVVGHMEDNPIGQVNSDHRWGNVVIIWHFGNVYSTLCHLKPGTIVVNEGDTVRLGQLIGRVGNSGRSVVPHLHFHSQSSPEIGSATIAAELLHYIIINGEHKRYLTHGIPQEGDRIAPIVIEEGVYETASFPLGRNWLFDVSFQGKNWREMWETQIDFSGDCFLACKSRRSRIRYSVNRHVLLFIDYEGPRNTGLYWFFMGLPRLPMTSEKISWKDELPGNLMMPAVIRFFYNLAEPIYPMAHLYSTSRFERTGVRFSVETILDQTGPLAWRKTRQVRIISHFDYKQGPVQIKAFVKDENWFELKQIPGKEA